MYKTFIFFFLLSYNLLSQTSIGKTEGAEIIQNENYYEVIFKTVDNKFSSFYIRREVEGKDGLGELKKYVLLLFKNHQENDFLLQFVDDSVLLIYKNEKVQMIKWKDHYSEKRECSQWFSFLDYLELFGLAPKKGTF